MRAVKILVLLVILAIIGVVVYVTLNAGSLVKQAIESVGPDYLGAPVTVDRVDVALTEGTASVHGLVIGNPAGFDGPYAMRLDRISVSLNPADITASPIVLKQITIDGAKVAALVNRAKETNFTTLMNHLNRTIGTPDNAETNQSDEVMVIIDRLNFTNASASVSSDILGTAEVRIPDIHLKNIGRKSNGVTMGEVAQQLLEPINAAIIKELLQKHLGTDQLKQNLEHKLKDKLFDKLNKLGRFGHPKS